MVHALHTRLYSSARKRLSNFNHMHGDSMSVSLKVFLSVTALLVSASASASQLVQATVQGVLTEVVVDAGSKSERSALVVQTDDGGRIVLQFENPFEVDAETVKLVGSQVTCQGLMADVTLMNAICVANK